MSAQTEPAPAAIDLFWIPLGAGGHCVRFNGKVYEALAAARRHQTRCDLYHAALVVDLEGERYTIEVAPSPDADEASRGVVATGPVGSRLLGWWRLFRYEVRCWRGGSIPDLAEAVGVPRRLSRDPAAARRLLAAAPRVPTPVWGRDELGAGDMWNSNSVVAWLISAAGLPADGVHPPAGGRAPGWRAGLPANGVPRRPGGRATPRDSRMTAGFPGGEVRSEYVRDRRPSTDGLRRRRGEYRRRLHNKIPQRGGAMSRSKFFKYAGIAASIVLIAFGAGAVYTGIDGRDRVQSDLAREQIVGTPDSSIPGQLVDTGSEAQAFAKVMRKHTLEATGGQTYAQMPRYLDKNGKGTNDEKAAAVDPKSGEPVANPARNIWINETALTTALNTAYFAESVATFAIVMGVAMLLSGIGFLILTLRVLREPAGEAKAVTAAAPRRQAVAA